MLTALLITLGVVSSLNFGGWLGRQSWKAWGKKKKSVAGLLCFPIAYEKDQIGVDDQVGQNPNAMIINFHKKNDAYNYAKAMAFVWPGKVLFNLCCLSYFALRNLSSKTIQLIDVVIGRAIDMAIYPTSSLFPKLAPKELAAGEPDPDQFDIDERQHLLEQRDKIDARLKEMDAHPDKAKILDQPRRF